jgi:hypothetical protein
MVLATRVGLAHLQRQHPKDERQRANADAEPGACNPLRGAEAAQHSQPIGQQADCDQRQRAGAHAYREKSERARAKDKGRDQTL